MEIELSNFPDRDIIYYFSKRILWGPVFIFAFSAFVVSPVFLFNEPLIMDVVFISLSVFIFFLMFDGFRLSYYFLLKKPALILTRKSLVDNINKQVYEWSGIFDITLHTYSKTIWINIGDGHKTNYLNTKTGLKKWMLKMHLDITHGAFWINPKSINVNKKELMDSLKKYHTGKR